MKNTRNRCLQLAEFVLGLNFEDIPEEVVTKEKDHILDGIGNGLYGSVSNFGQMVKNYLKNFPSESEAVLWGSQSKVTVTQAAFANSSFSNYLELEDAHHRTKFKPNTILTPAAIAIAEKTGASGKDVLTALIAANEICLRIATATHVGKEGYARGWIGTSSIGGFGTAAITARLLDLSVEELGHALSIAGSQPCGIWSGGMAMSKRVLIGQASENGIRSAIMAKEGLTGDFDIFDGNWGNIGDIISPVYQPDIITRDLGSDWMTLEIGLENYPTKGGAHSAIDCVLELLKSNNFMTDEIDDILVRATTGIASNKALQLFPPTNFYEAQNSMPYILAVTLIDKQCTTEQFTDEKIRDSKILDLAKLVRIESSEEADRLAPKTKTTFVDLKLKDGRTLTSRIDYCKGEPENPLSRVELNEKFKRVACEVLDERRMDQVIEVVGGLEEIVDFSSLTELLSE